jgi:Uma2 family endonuclease
MRGASRSTSLADLRPFPIIADGLPLIYEDDDEGDMGEATIHTDSVDIVLYGAGAHLADQPQLRVFSNLNLYYSPTDRKAYASPDLMVAEPEERERDFESYRIGTDGPTPLMVAEVLSERTGQQGDLREKVRIYALIGIREYILIDVTGRFLSQRLLVKRLRRNRTWKDEQDLDGGVTSKLGFRLIIDTDGRLRMVNAMTGGRYLRPGKAMAEVRTRREAEERIRALEEELARLRGAEAQAKKGKGRRRKS